VTSVAVKSRYTLTRPATGMRTAQQGIEVHTLSRAIEHIADASGRFRYTMAGEELRGKINPDGTVNRDVKVPRVFREIVAFDGATGRRLYGDADTWKSAEVSHEHASRLPVNPLHFGTHFVPQALLDYLDADHEWTIAGTAEIDGRDMLVLESRASQAVLQRVRKHHPGLDWWYRFWIDPERGHILVHAKHYVQRRQDTEPFVCWSFQGSEWTETAPQIWMPGRTEHIVYGAPEQGPFPLRYKLVGIHEGWVVNQPLAADAFQLSFPAGVKVSDLVLGRGYTSSAIDDGTVARAAARARMLLEQSRNQPTKAQATPSREPTSTPVEPSVTVPSYSIFAYTRTWLYLFGTLLALAAVAITYATLRRR
jgi:hypothetical protein